MYYRDDLSYIHDQGYRGHADDCAPSVLALLEPVRERRGKVVEFGCGSGALTRHLAGAGHDVIATDASGSMLRLAESRVLGPTFQRLLLPDDPIPEADAIVGVGHPINYLDSLDEIHEAFRAMAAALKPGGLLVTDVCDLQWADDRHPAPLHASMGIDWALITEYERPEPDVWVRNITTFVQTEGDIWRRGFEEHRNVLLDTSTLPEFLADLGLDAEVRPAFGDETLPTGLLALVATRRG